MKIVMLGAPGAGKGTQAKMISEKYSIPHISTGDIFRANIKENTELGQKAKTYMDKGLLVPDELVVDLVVDRLAQDDAKKGYVLDGFPRTIPQAEALTEALAKIGEKMDYAINVEVPDADSIDLPIAVLIDDQSISAAEFFAAALQEYDRATLVGTHTTGKGRAQRTYQLSDGSAVNLSVEEYFTPKGKSLADVGIAPDIEVKLTDEQTQNFFFLTSENDPQLQKAMETVG